jgi:molybdopterin-guanine dinucleotide biosynthesis protein B
LQESFPQVVAIASDHPESEGGSLPVFDLDDVKGIADFVIATVGLKQP